MIEKISYERRAYESVNDVSLSWVIYLNKEMKFFLYQKVKSSTHTAWIDLIQNN